MTWRTTEEADEDLVLTYIEGFRRFGETQADRYHARLYRTFDLLAENPAMARERRELRPPMRVHPCGSHVVLYRVDTGGNILIVRVRHSREDWLGDRTG